MYPASGAFRNAIWSSERRFRRRLTITTVDRTITLLDEDLMFMEIRDAVVTSNEIEIGTAVSKELNFTINNIGRTFDNDVFAGAEVVAAVNLNNLEWIPLGRYFIDEAPRPGRLIEVTAFDVMVRFDRPYRTNLAFPTTVLHVVQDMCQQVGIQLATTSFINSGYIIQEIPRGLTFRQVLRFCSQIAGSFARIDRQGHLRLSWYTETDEAIHESHLFRIQVEEPIIVTGVVYYDPLEEIEYVVGSEDYAIELEENPLITTGVETLLANIGVVVLNTSFVPGEIVHQGNPCWDAGDIIRATDDAGIQYKMLVCDNIHSFQGFRATTKSVAKTESQIGYATAGVVNARVSSIRKHIKELDQELLGEITSREAAIENITNLMNSKLGGYVLKRANELLIMDHPNPEQAVKIWRWNLAGLAYSDNVVGADNPSRVYQTAMTMDGQIVATFITTGILNADIIRTGIFSSSDGNAWMNLDNGTFSLGPDLVWDGSELTIRGSITITGGNAATKTEVSDAEQAAKLHADSAASAAISHTDNQFNLLNGEIAQRVPQTDFNNLATRVTTAEATLTVHANQIAQRVTQSQFDALGNRVSNTEATLTTHADQIAARVTQTTFNNSLATKQDNVIIQNTAPAHLAGRLWLNTSVTPNVLNRSTGTAWVPATPTTPAQVGAFPATDGNNLATRVTTAEATLTVQANQIAQRVTQTDFNALGNRVSSAESSIVQNATAITQRVLQTDYNGNTIASLINQTATTIRIQANRINLVGAVTISDLATETTHLISNTADAARTNAREDLALSLGYSSYNDMVVRAVNGQTIIQGGQIRTSLIDANAILANFVRVSTDLIVGAGNNLAGISGVGTTGDSIRFWAGSSVRSAGHFRVGQDGRLVAGANAIEPVLWNNNLNTNFRGVFIPSQLDAGDHWDGIINRGGSTFLAARWKFDHSNFLRQDASNFSVVFGTSAFTVDSSGNARVFGNLSVDGSLTGVTLSASDITSGTFDRARIPTLDASIITAGTFDRARIPTLDASIITAGTLGFLRIPTGTTSTTVAVGNHTHVASSINSGTFDRARIPTLDASIITAGTLGFLRIPTGTTSTTVAVGNHTHTTFGNLTTSGAMVFLGTRDNTTSLSANMHIGTASGTLQRVTSSKKYKQDIEPYFSYEVLGLSPVTFRDKKQVMEQGEKAPRILGLIAEEVDEFGLRELVSYNANGTAEAVNYDRIAVAMLPVLKSHDEEIRELKARVKYLEEALKNVKN